jgi:5-methylcytosine-specific restriction endonuclease McrA
MCNKEYIGGKRTCSRACANRAREGISYTGENKNNKAYIGSTLKKKIADIRGGICERCKMKNYAILQVHHKVEKANGGTDRMSNLELLCPNCHMTHHLGKSLFEE